MKRFLKIIAVLLIIAVIGVFLWLYIWSSRSSADPQAEALRIMEEPTVSRDGSVIVFEPQGTARSVALIYYPGGLVEPEAYAPVANEIAQFGFPVFVPEMPFNLAVTRAGRATAIIADNPEIDTWVIGGHSLGGAMAASYVNDNPEAVDGLILYAATASRIADFSERDLPILSVYGTRDRLVSERVVNRFRDLLPDDATFVPIQGGNHAQFGDYGVQGGDGEATISAEAQWQQIVLATVSFMGEIEQEIER